MLSTGPIEPHPIIEQLKREIDMTLLDANLKLTVEERIENLMKLQRFAEELRLAGEQHRAEQRAKT